MVYTSYFLISLAKLRKKVVKNNGFGELTQNDRKIKVLHSDG